MLRGSKPGERRGGRKRGTPNRRMILTDRILSIGLDCPTAPRSEFLLRLVSDPKLPADIRTAVAPRCFPARQTSSRRGRPAKESAVAATTSQSGTAPLRDWRPQALDALRSIVQDATADNNARRKAALKYAQFLLPTTPKQPKAQIDQYGFRISWKAFNAYRDIGSKLRAFRKEQQKTRAAPEVARQIAQLKAKSDAILERCDGLDPSKYSVEAGAKDFSRLMEFADLRGDGVVLSEAQEIEETRIWMRIRS